jgi:hypothetical protein
MTQTSQHAFGFQRPQLSARRACRVQDVAALCDALTSNTRLSELSCSCHPLSPGAAARFGAALAANGALRSVSVGDSSFGDAGLAAMAGGLAANKGLTRLDLEHKVGQLPTLCVLGIRNALCRPVCCRLTHALSDQII